ncbi:MAG: LysR family transcriptional regulator [Lentisphaeraceae bacterium]|nr:LysR family transcriptional regulator [Lentisphaeraceae bacterium]
MDQLKAMKLFCRVAELGSYSKAADEQALSRSAVSRTMTQLEEYLGIKLINRSTRKLLLTDAGQEYYRESERLLRSHQTLEDRMRQGKADVKGLLRIGVPGPFAERYLLGDIKIFIERYPGIRISLHVSEDLSDLYTDELDLVIRTGPMRDSSLNVVPLNTMTFTLCASPAYLKKYGIPKKPQDFRSHNCLCFRGRGRGSHWNFHKNNKHVNVPVGGNVAADCGNTLRYFATEGMGIVGMPSVLIQKELDKGSLTAILTDWKLNHAENEDSMISILYHPDRTQLQRIRAFIDFMKEPERLIQQI